MFDLIFSPLNAIASVKSERSTGKAFITLIVASLFAAIAAFIKISSLGTDSATSIGMAFLLLILFFVLTLFFAFLLKLSFNVLSQKGGYSEALMTLSSGFFISSSGFLVASLLQLLQSGGAFVAVVMNILAGIVLLISFILSNAVMLRMAAELFETDLFTTIIAFIIVYLSMVLTLFFLVVGILPQLYTQLISSFSPAASAAASTGL